MIANYKADQVKLVGDRSEVRMDYLFDAKLYTKPAGEPSDTVTGYGILNFYSDGSNTFNRGDGYFIDNSGVTVRKRRVSLKRIKLRKPHSDEHEILFLNFCPSASRLTVRGKARIVLS